MKRPKLSAFDRKQLGEESVGVLGVDEAGRGALAGPVVAGAVMVQRDFYDSPACRRIRPLIRDSKTLIFERREAAFAALEKCRDAGGILFSPGVATVEEIADHNILGATRIAMKRAIDSVLEVAACPVLSWEECGPDDLFYDEAKAALVRRRPVILIDGKPLRPFFYPHRAQVQGDGKSFAIAAASIVAKVTRDRLMVDAHSEFEAYGFDSHKGYCTPRHVEALELHGPSDFHRQKFLRRLIAAAAGEDDEATLPMFDDEELQAADPQL